MAAFLTRKRAAVSLAGDPRQSSKTNLECRMISVEARRLRHCVAAFGCAPCGPHESHVVRKAVEEIAPLAARRAAVAAVVPARACRDEARHLSGRRLRRGGTWAARRAGGC